MTRPRICIIAEGCYPYVVGGVSGWVQSLIRNYPDYDFVLQTIIVGRETSGKFAYEIPENLLEVHETYLQDDDYAGRRKKRHLAFGKEEKEAFRSLLLGEQIQWDYVFDLFEKRHPSVNHLLMSDQFMEYSRELYQNKYSNTFFSDFIWTMRSMYLPLFLAMNTRMPKADLYHGISTGYAGILGSMAKQKYGSPLMISEHGIYTREREEELIKAKWVKGIYKDVWISQFGKMSRCAYQYADKVTSLFEDARKLQIDLGCPEEKTAITPNGVHMENFKDLRAKEWNDSFINCGAVLRVTPIKDVKTMIQAFSHAKEQVANLKLWIMGPLDEDPEYVTECRRLIDSLGIRDVVFTGRIRVTEYLGKMDFLLLTSISEGQPLSILEGFAAKKPCVATNVGNCKGLLYGERDDFGAAGILTPVMSVDRITEAIVKLAQDTKLCKTMGENGYRRCQRYYSNEQMVRTYQDLYGELLKDSGKGGGNGRYWI